MRMRRDLPAEVALAVVSLILFFGFAEAGLRLSGYGPEPSLPGTMYVASATRGYDLKPGYQGAGERSPYLVHPPISINRIGMRGPDISLEPLAGTFRALCLGDSYVFGWGVRQDETFPARLQARLSEASAGGVRFEALNAGVPAYGSLQELDQLREKGPFVDPDLVVVGFVLNDALPGGDRRPHLAIPFKDALRRSAVYRFLGRLYQQGALTAIAEASTDDAKTRDIVAYEKGNTEVLESGRPEIAEARAAVVEGIAGMRDESARLGSRFLVVVFPNRHQIEDPAYERARFNETLTAELAAVRVESIDLFARYKEAARSVPLYLADTHPNALAHDLAARAVVERILQVPGDRR